MLNHPRQLWDSLSNQIEHALLMIGAKLIGKTKSAEIVIIAMNIESGEVVVSVDPERGRWTMCQMAGKARRTARRNERREQAPTTQPARPLPDITIIMPGKSAVKPEALAFMAWVQKGVSDGSLPYNAAGAPVHFVRYKEDVAMLLVSPLIFRRFDEARGKAQHAGVMPGKTVQLAVTAAGWHLRSAGGKNVVSYQVVREGEHGGNLLNGFLVLQPERFFNPVPQTNDRLVFWNAESVRKEE